MARRTFDEIDAELLLMVANRTDLTAAMRNFALDQAYYHVASMFKHPELEGIDTPTLADNATSFTMDATDVWWITSVRDTTNERPVHPMSRETDQALTTKPDGAPSRYVYYNETLYVDRKADGAVAMAVDYYQRPAELGGSSTSALDHVFDEVILMMAAKFAFIKVRDFDESKEIDREIVLYLGRQRIPWREHKVAADQNAGLRVRLR
jgi:hypothetical protein